MDDNTILFESFDDMKPFLGSAFSGMNIENLNSDLRNSLSDIAIITGNELLNDLVQKYRDDNLTEAEDALVNVIRKPLANMCFYRHSNSGTMAISDSGYSTEEGANSKRPWQWQIRNFQKQRLADYAAGMNELWKYLVDNSSDFADWLDTEEYRYLQVRPINEVKEWGTAGRRIANWRTHYALLPEMNMVWEDMDVIISEGLLDVLNDYLLNGTTPDEDLDALLPYIQRYVAHATVARAANSLPVSIEAEGLLILEVNSTTANSDTVKQEIDKNLILNHANSEACKAKSRLKEYLDATATADVLEPYYTEFLANPADPVVLNEDGDKLLLL